MFEKVFACESKLWNWLVVSSADPTKVAITIKGIVGVFLVFIATFIHNPNLNDIPDLVYSFVVAFFGLFSALSVVIGLVRKIWLSLFPAPITE